VFFLETRKRQKQGEVQRLLCRLLNSSSPELATGGLESRDEARAAHIRPMTLATEFDGEPAAGEALFGLTGDLCTHGLSVYVAHPVKTGKVFIGLWLEGKAHIFLGCVKNVVPIGGGFHRVGVELNEIAPPDGPGMATMRSLTEELRN
jgi:hypothetical protein